MVKPSRPIALEEAIHVLRRGLKRSLVFIEAHLLNIMAFCRKHQTCWVVDVSSLEVGREEFAGLLAFSVSGPRSKHTSLQKLTNMAPQPLV